MGMLVLHTCTPVDQAGTQHSQSPMIAEDGQRWDLQIPIMSGSRQKMELKAPAPKAIAPRAIEALSQVKGNRINGQSKYYRYR